MASNKKKKRRRARGLANPLVRVALGAALVLLVVLLSVGMTNLMAPPSDETIARLTAASNKTDEEPVVPTATPEPTEVPEPTLTPTPAVYAPFGAQYGFGGEELIPETPIPQNTPIPQQTPAPTEEPAPESTSLATLRKGASGKAVTRMQEALIALGFLHGEADGNFGAKTQEAVIMFQVANSLSADGVAGQRTLSVLYSGSALSYADMPEMDYVVLVNRERPLDKTYMPTDLVNIADIVPSNLLKIKYSGTKANRTAVEALRDMLSAAAADGLSDFQVSSAYRGYADQQKLVDQKAAEFRKNNPTWSTSKCLSATYVTVAPAGTSEHQTGLSFDITVPGVSFTGTAQQKWLHKHCAEYGFVVRFTEAKEKLTGFVAESWHFRYVGKEVAAILTKNNWCLEEYYSNMGL